MITKTMTEYQNNLVIDTEIVMEAECAKTNIKYNTTFVHIIEDFSFGNLPKQTVIEIFKDGRPFSYFMEAWLAVNYPLIHIKGCKPYDHVNVNDENIKYDQKTFALRDCKFMPSNMIGQGRLFNKEVFEEKAKKLIYIIVGTRRFPEIKIRFVKGVDLIANYPKGVIPSHKFDEFFD